MLSAMLNSRFSLRCVVVTAFMMLLSRSLAAQSPQVEHGSAQLSGMVTAESGAPLEGVRIRVGIPQADMRFVHSGTKHRTRATTTDRLGRFSLVVDKLTGPTEISVDAMQPRFERLSGAMMRRSRQIDMTIKPGRKHITQILLKPAMYLKGIVVDEDDKPISGVEVSAIQIFNGGQSSGGVEQTSTNKDGVFEIFNYRDGAVDAKGAKRDGMVTFFHPNYLTAPIEGVYDLPVPFRDSLRVVLPSGHRIAGKLIGADGKAAKNLLVKAVPVQADALRKATKTDNDGRFQFAGVPGGEVNLSCVDYVGKQRMKLAMQLTEDQQDITVKLEAVVLPGNLPTYNVLGMQVTDMNRELQVAYDSTYSAGVLILDPGANAARLDIGDLEAGDVFWQVGKTNVRDTADFAGRILVAAKKTGQHSRVRVVFGMSRVELDGTNTQYMKLTDKDLAELKSLTDRQKGPVSDREIRSE